MAKALNKRFKMLDSGTSREVVDFLFEHIIEELYKAKKVTISDFMSMQLDIAKPKKFYNVATGENATLPYRWVFKNKLSKKFNEKVSQKPCYISESGEHVKSQ